MPSAGIVAIDNDQKWIGGRYYLQHLIRCVASLPPTEQIRLRDVSWAMQPGNDPFEEVRPLLGEAVVVSPPAGFVGRAARKIRRVWKKTPGARDLFDAQGIGVFFPLPPCENSGTPYVFWLPDFQYLRRPDLMSEKLRTDLQQYFFWHVHQAAQIVLSSEDAQRDFAGVYPELLDRTHVVRFCSVPDEDWWKLDPKQVAAQHGLPERFFIVCNQFTRHKNHLTLMKALQLLTEQGRNDIHLVCTGSTFDHRQEDYIGQVNDFLRRHALQNRVHILGLIPRAEQIALLRRSIAVLQPSWFEGWSTIIEDAKTLGKPVLASDLPVHHEQLDTSHAFIGLDDAEQWAAAIGQAWSTFAAGPNAEQEAAGLDRLEVAKRECGLAFVKALRSALPDGD